MARDNFSKPTKRALAEKAGFRCSYPQCPAITIGPSDESNTATSNTGEAAHIAAAAAGPGARRYDPKMTPDQRSSIDNGIWCCNTHATLIDTDEVTYTVQMLKHWRVLAERRAQIRQAYGDNVAINQGDLIELGLAPDEVTVNDTFEINDRIGSAVQLSWLQDICGKEIARILRDFLIEYSRNSLTHGRATFAKITFNQKSIEVSDDGTEFRVHSLRSKNSRGGGMALAALLDTKELGHVSSHRTEDGRNVVHIPFVLGAFELPHVNPCAISLSREVIRMGSINTARFISCDSLYIVAPNFVSYSDGPLFEQVLRDILNHHSNVVLILPEASERVMTHFQELFPSAQVETW